MNRLPSHFEKGSNGIHHKNYSKPSKSLESEITSTDITITTETSTLLPSILSSKNSSNASPLLLVWNDPWFLSIVVTVTMLMPTLIGGSIFLCKLTGRKWPATLCALHISLALAMAHQFQTTATTTTTTTKQSSFKRRRQIATSLASLIDIALCGRIYPAVCQVFGTFFMDIDGTIVSEWSTYQRILQLLQVGMFLVVTSRILVGSGCWIWILNKHPPATTATTTTRIIPQLFRPALLSTRVRLLGLLERIQRSINPSFLAKHSPSLKTRMHKIFLLLSLISMGWSGICLASCMSHFTNWHLVPVSGQHKINNLETDSHACCDDLDRTECALPFPSFHHMIPDATSLTGWRVLLEGRSLPPMRGGIPLDPSFLNELDGFSTMAPILFYLEGLQESHLAEMHGAKVRVFPTLATSNNKLQDSITNRSITLLWDVQRQELITHTAQVDQLDPDKPFIIVIPSKPLHHGSHYAVAVINATDSNGVPLPPTPGMKALFSETDFFSCRRDSGRLERYQNVALPSLKRSAPWLNNDRLDSWKPDDSLQLLFDFVTMSDDSLQDIRNVRDTTIQRISSPGHNHHRAEVVKIINRNCRRNNTLVARTIHGSLTVPWFLNSQSRDAILDPKAFWNKSTQNEYKTGHAKFVVHVPCSLRAAALDDPTRIRRPLRTILEYGHGLFYNRAESYEYSLLRLAEDQGYLIMAMDWRGMSSFDMPIVMKTMLSAPKLFQATRDNLIQGYANKLTMLHFAQNGMLDEDWLTFMKQEDKELYKIPTFDGTEPTTVFYGSSQGGILGAGYTTLLGPTGLIARGVLGVPGTSFSLIMSRSNSFETYDGLLIKNFYNNRHVRLLLSVIQLGWDPVEAAGMLAPPIQEPFPPMLLQAGLGDATVPHIATEALARAYNASVLPNNPRSNLFGIPTAPAAANNSIYWDNRNGRPHVTLTEILYEQEYQSLPVDNVYANFNVVHMCLRQDCALIAQMAEFINTGRIIDPCVQDRCRRSEISCNIYGRRNNTKANNWTCSYNQSSLLQ